MGYRYRVTRRRLLAVGAAGGALAIRAAQDRRNRIQVLAQDATGTPDGAQIEYPTAADDLVLRIAYVGGFVPVTSVLQDLPALSLYGDGRVITTGPQIEIYPPPALPNLRQTTITEEGIQAVLAAADEAGLIGQSREYGNALVADAATTVFTVHAGGQVTTVSAYALGVGDDPSWTDAERRELAKLQRFAAQVTDLATMLPAGTIETVDEPYPIERLQVVSEPLSGLPAPDPSDPTQNQPPLDWPLERSLSDYEPIDLPGVSAALRCGVVEGDDTERLLPAVEGANALTPWVSGGEEFRVSFRPLLPDEEGCPPRSELSATPEA